MTSRATYDDVLVRVRGLAGTLLRPPVMGIGGHGGAGKTTLARRLASDLGFTAEQVVRTDRLYAATDTRRAGMFDLQDWPGILDLLGRVRADPAPGGCATPRVGTTARRVRSTCRCPRS